MRGHYILALPLLALFIGCGDTREKADEVMNRSPEEIQKDIDAAKEAMGREIDPQEIIDRSAENIEQLKEKYYELRYELKQTYRETFEKNKEQPQPDMNKTESETTPSTQE